MKISERGQVTIPRELRDKYGFLPNTEVDFVVKEGALMLVRKTAQQQKSIEALYAKKKFGKSTDELMALLRDE
jgi:AbrB family looped-hinge helix DNA binding protein